MTLQKIKSARTAEKKAKKRRRPTLSDAEANEIARRLTRIKAEKAATLRDQVKYRENNAIEFFTRPNPPQSELLEGWMLPQFKTFTFTGGNRLGKTTIGTIIAISTLFGYWPWSGEKLPLFHHQPRKVRYVGQDWEKHVKAVVVPALKKWWPKTRKVEVRKNSQGVEAYWKDTATGSTLEIMSNKQESELHEGWEGDLLVFDEPPTRPVYIANARGLIDRAGRELICATLLKEAWVDQEIIKKRNPDGTADRSVFNVHGEIYDNVGYGLTQEAVDMFSTKLKPAEREARLLGKPSYLSGLVCPRFDRKRHLIDRFEIPSHWMVDIAIDTHPRKEQAMLFMATDPHNLRYVFREVWDHGDGEWIADRIIKIANEMKLRVHRVICDPLAKGDPNNENTTYDKIGRRLFAHNIILETATKDKDSGIIQINNHLWGPNKKESIYFFDDLVRTITEIEGWIYDKETQKPQKEQDDMMENLYRLLLLDTVYVEPEDEMWWDDEEALAQDYVNVRTGY